MEDRDKALAELEAMRKVVEAVTGLDQEAQVRVIRWVAEKYRAGDAPSQKVSAARGNESATSPEGRAITDIGDLLAISKPRSGTERALVAAYWLQVVQRQPEFDSHTLNRELNHLGYRLANVTSTLSSLINQRPQLVIQTRKTGKALQSRKRYKLTREGILRVEQMIGPGAQREGLTAGSSSDE